MAITVRSIRESTTHQFAEGPFSLTVGEFDPTLVYVRSFRGRECLSRPFVFDVRVVVNPDVPHALFDQALINADAHFVIGQPGAPAREVNGVVTRVRSFGADAQGRAAYELRIMPPIARLARRRMRRIFQEKTVVEIAIEVLGRAPIEVLPKLAKIYPRRTYCVQYDETDLAFVERLLAEEGIFYFFRHHDKEVQLVLGDAPMAYVYVEDQTIPVVTDRGLGATEDHIDELTAERAIRPGRATVREFDFLRPTLKQTVDMALPAPRDPFDVGYAEPDFRDLEVYDHYDEFEGGDLGKDVAAMHLDAHRRDALVFRGRGATRRAAPGFRFDCDWALAHDLGRELCFVRVDHTGTAPALPNEPAVPVTAPYAAKFTAIPAGVTYRPKRPKRRVQQVLETARIVGPRDADIHVDELGRVKVQFHWDRQYPEDGSSSCWIRVSQVWAGTGWGFQFVPRIGMEVLVSFITGDTDKPVILGAVGNTETPEIYTLPEHKTKSGIRTRSTGDKGLDHHITGYNEISFEDKLGQEHFHMQAEREMSELVKGNRQSTIRGNDTTSVGANTRWITGASSTFITGGDSTSSVGLNLTESVGHDLSHHVGHNATYTVDHHYSLHVTGAREDAIGRDWALRVDGSARHKVGKDYTLHVSRNLGLLVDGGASVGAQCLGFTVVDALDSLSDTVLIEGKTSIVFMVGGSQISITDDEITITANSIKMVGNETWEAIGSNSKVTLDGDATVVGGTTTIQGSGGEVKVDASVTVAGGSIALKSGGGGSHSNSSDSSSSENENVHLDIGIDVDDGNATTGALVFRDKDGNEVARKEASAATVRSSKRLVFELDVEAHADPVTGYWVEGDAERHIVGPAKLKDLRDAFQRGRHQLADRLQGRRGENGVRPRGAMAGRPVLHERGPAKRVPEREEG